MQIALLVIGCLCLVELWMRSSQISYGCLIWRVWNGSILLVMVKALRLDLDLPSQSQKMEESKKNIKSMNSEDSDFLDFICLVDLMGQKH